jgi:hypothetical protein
MNTWSEHIVIGSTWQACRRYGAECNDEDSTAKQSKARGYGSVLPGDLAWVDRVGTTASILSD